jgi:hypothetical protein
MTLQSMDRSRPIPRAVWFDVMAVEQSGGSPRGATSGLPASHVYIFPCDDARRGDCANRARKPVEQDSGLVRTSQCGCFFFFFFKGAFSPHGPRQTAEAGGRP